MLSTADSDYRTLKFEKSKDVIHVFQDNIFSPNDKNIRYFSKFVVKLDKRNSNTAIVTLEGGKETPQKGSSPKFCDTQGKLALVTFPKLFSRPEVSI